MYETTISKYLEMMRKLQVEPIHSFDTASRNIPDEPGVYVICNNKEKRVIYVGRTKNLKRRILRNHRSGNIEGSQFRKALGKSTGVSSEAEITKFIMDNCSFQFLVLQIFEEAVRLEHFITAILAPTLNVQLRQ